MKPVVDQIVSAKLATILSTVMPVVMLILLELIFFFDIWDFYHMLTGHFTSIGNQFCSNYISFFFFRRLIEERK